MIPLLPDPTQTLLLHAAMDEGESALAAFDQWQRRVDIVEHHLDSASFRLLPLLHANLKRLGCDSPLMARLNGMHRHSWARSQSLLHDAAATLAIFTAAGVPTMVNKGLALGLAHYRSLAHRPMSDIDIIVPVARVAEAVELLYANRWHPAPTRRRKIVWSDLVLYRHSVNFLNEAGRELDLHWALSAELVSPAAIERIWETAVPLVVLDQPTVRPSATNILLHTAIHGMRRNEMPPLRWIADFGTVLRTEGDKVDWDDMVDFAERTRVVRRFGMALDYVSSEMGFPVPPSALAATRRSRGSTIAERVEDWSALSDPETSWLRRRLKPGAVGAVAAMARLVANDHGGHIPRIVGRWIGRQMAKWRRRAYARLR